MVELAYFDVERGEAVVPWRVKRPPPWAAYAFFAFWWVLVIIAAVSSGWDPLGLLLVSLLLLLVVPWLVNKMFAWLQKSGEPLAIGPDEMVCQTGSLAADYIRWSDVATVAHVHAGVVMGWMPPFYQNLLVYKRAGGMVRFMLPRMSGEEFEQYWAVLQTVSRRHHFTLLSDRTNEGELQIRKLRWF